MSPGSSGSDTLKLLVATADLEAAAEEMAGEPRIGVDTEFLREKTYHPRLCLIQVATSQSIWLVDPFAGIDLAPLAKALGHRRCRSSCTRAGRT